MSKQILRILFLTDDREDYLADGLLHGLRRLPSVELVDYPRKECMYEGGRKSSVAPEFGVRGGGFSLYGLLQEPPGGIDRSQIYRRLEAGWFDAVVLSNLWRQWGLLMQWRELLARQPLLLLDGDDDERLYPRSGTRFRQFGIANGLNPLLQTADTHIYKRELTNRSKPWGLRLQVHPLGFSIPAAVVFDSVPIKTQMFQTHIVDRELLDLTVGSNEHFFVDESAYRTDLGAARFGITTRRAGWDCLRHYEIAASGTIPCFRNLNNKPPNCAPHGLVDGFNCLSYSSAADLHSRIKYLTDNDELLMQQHALEWAHQSSTTMRAQQLLDFAQLPRRSSL